MIVVQHLNAGKKVDSALDFSLNFTIAQEFVFKGSSIKGGMRL